MGLLNRREIIVASGVAVLGAQRVHGAKPARMKPQIGDVLVRAFGERAGALIGTGDVVDDRVFAFAMSVDGLVRDGSLHNQVSLLRVDEAAMSEKMQRFAAGPFVAVSAACTHTGCEVSEWLRASSELVCPCHGSRFDVLDAARVVNGPATKPLALLPIELRQGIFHVAGKFSRRVGPEPTY